MKPPSIRIAILLLIYLPFLTFLLAQDARDSTVQPTPSASPAAPQTEASQTVAKPEAVSNEVSKLLGFPKLALQLEPGLPAAMQLTPEQQQDLKSAWEETVNQSKTDTADNEDKRQTQKIAVRAQREFDSRRGTILGSQQITLINAVHTALVNALAQAKQAKPAPGEKKVDMRALFLKELKPSLSADQVALVEATGGKFP